MVVENWAPLQSLIRILRVSLAQIDTEMTKKYAIGREISHN